MSAALPDAPAERPRRVPPGRLRRHPALRTRDELTLGERAADRLRNGMGSWTFVFAALVFLAGWMVGNRGSGFDPYPFILLNLVLSCVAALQGAILLIAAKRADQISSDLAAHDYAADQDSEQLIKEVRALVRAIHHQVGAPDPVDVPPDGPGERPAGRA